MMTRRVLPVVAFAAVVAVYPAAQTPPAQQPPPQQQAPVFRGGVDSVSVDVVVTDKQGRPVADLTAEDFEVREDGEPQKIDTFRFLRAGEAVSGPTRSSATSNILSMAQQDTETGRPENRVFAIFLDDYHTRRLNSLRIRKELADFVRTLQPYDLVALVYPLLPVAAITFSRDHDGTAMALLNFEGRKYDYTPKNPYETRLVYMPPSVIEQERNRSVMTALEGLCLYLGSLREGRKSVIFVSEGFISTMPPGVFTRGTMSPAASPFGATLPADERLEQINMSDLQAQLRYVFIAASRTNTSIYTLDPRGLTPNEFSVEDRVDPSADRRALNVSTDTLYQIASETDGRPIVNRNDPTPGLVQMLTDSSAYYLLSYVSAEAPRDGKFHKIDVKVRRGDIEVRARKGYWAYTPEDVERALAPPKPGPAPDVAKALTNLVTVTDAASRRPLIAWIGATQGDGPEAHVTLVWEASGGASSAVGFDAVGKVELVVTSGVGDELFRGEVPKRADALRPAGTVSFDAPPGLIQVRLTAENDRGVRLESSQIEFEVPDYTAVEPLITPPVVFRARTARDVQQLRAATDPVPAASRTFLRSERLLLRFEAFAPGGVLPEMTMALLNKQGDSLADLPSPTLVSGNRFEAVVGLGSLPPGEYLLAITATAGGQTTRELLAVKVTS